MNTFIEKKICQGILLQMSAIIKYKYLVIVFKQNFEYLSFWLLFYFYLLHFTQMTVISFYMFKKEANLVKLCQESPNFNIFTDTYIQHCAQVYIYKCRIFCDFPTRPLPDCQYKRSAYTSGSQTFSVIPHFGQGGIFKPHLPPSPQHNANEIRQA